MMRTTAAKATTMMGPAQAFMNDSIRNTTMVISSKNAIMPIHSGKCGNNIRPKSILENDKRRLGLTRLTRLTRLGLGLYCQIVLPKQSVPCLQSLCLSKHAKGNRHRFPFEVTKQGGLDDRVTG